MGKKFLIFVTSLLLSTVLAFAQSGRTVTGKVTSSEDGSPLTGASVLVEGTKLGTYADLDGNFTLKGVPENAKTLVISLLGMEEKRVAIAPNVNVVLNPDSRFLDETVVVAYGKQNRKSITGSVAVIDNKKLEARTTTSATGALEGAAPGIQVNNTYGEPGKDPKIRIRGFGSINGEQSPLVVVDGAVYFGNISEINPADIENISVLKDASSAALYGNRASNGVIMINTKSGSGNNKPAITVNINQGIYNRGIPEYDRLDADKWMEASWIAMKNFAMTSKLNLSAENAAKYATEHLIGDYTKLNIYDGDAKKLFDVNGKLIASKNTNYSDLDWYSAVARLGHRQDYTVSGRVASSKFNLYASAGYLNEKGYIIYADYKRFTGRVNTTFTPTKWFKAGLNVNFTAADKNFSTSAEGGSYYSNPFYIIRYMAPIYPYYAHKADGSFDLDDNGKKKYNTAGYLSNRNIVYELNNDKQISHRNVIGSQAFATLMLPYGFSFTVKGDINHSNTDENKYDNPVIGDGHPNGRLSHTTYRYFVYTLQELLNWEYRFGLHNVEFLAGHENYQYERHYNNSMNTDMVVPGNYTMGNFLKVASNIGSYDRDASDSYLARVRYNFAERYYFDASFRRDGSSRFHPDNRWGSFFSLGASWNIKNEKFLKNVNWVNSLRLRAAFGEVGNNASAGLYAYQALYQIEKYGGKQAFVKQTLPAKDIKWETTRTFDLGLEGSFFDERLNFSLGLFDKRSVDLLFNVLLPLSAGSSTYSETGYNMSVLKNIGTVSNSGLELNISGDVIRTRDWTWSLGLDATFFKNKIVKLPNEEGLDNGKIRRYALGKSVYEYYTYHFVGVDRLTGRSLYTLDTNKKNVAKASAAGELVEINGVKYATDVTYGKRDWAGSAIPFVYGSFSTSLRWKNLSLRALFTYSLGGKTYDGIYQSLMSTSSATSASANHKDILKSWNGAPAGMTETSADRIDPKGLPTLDFNRSNYSNAISDRWLVSSSYLVLKNINLSYTFPTKLVNKVGLEGLSLNAGVENLFTLSARKGLNPQQSFNGGLDDSYVTARVFNVGLTVKF